MKDVLKTGVRISHRFVTLICILLSICTGCKKTSNLHYDVEIAPTEWLTIDTAQGKCWFVCQWDGKRVTWDGKRNRLGETQLPITLRKHENILYLIVLDREDLDHPKFIFLKLNKSGTRFTKIDAKDFPKSIATQNMLLDSRTRMVTVNDKRIDSWEVIRNLDHANSWFFHSYTGAIWIELETGMGLRESMGLIDVDLKQRLFRDYSAKYSPIRLPTLVRDEELEDKNAL